MGEKQIATVDNFVRGETGMTLKRSVDQGAFGQLFHLHQPTPLDQQGVIRMNCNALDSIDIFDLAEPVTICGWDDNPDEAASHNHVVSSQKNGTTPHALTVKNVSVDGFCPIRVYNKDSFIEPNDQNAYSYNNMTAKKNLDGSITIHFGGGPDAINNLPITAGWNYLMRLYQPRQGMLDGADVSDSTTCS